MSGKVIVIGAGAAGLMAAGTARLRGVPVTVFDKNERPARKVMITGKGRCNITNDCGRNEIIAAVRSNGRFLYSALSQFSAQDTMAFFERQGVPVKVERGNRVFPVSDRAVDVVDALVHFAKGAGAAIKTGQVTEIITHDGRVSGVVVGANVIDCDAVIISTGGLSYPGTGSTGDGYRFAQAVGHTVVLPRASLVPIEIKERACRDMQGLSLKNVTLSVTDKQSGKLLFSELGEMLFTHFGVSGPLVLSASAHMTKKATDYELSIDLKPALSLEQLDARLQRDFTKFQNKVFINSLSELLPKKMIPVVVSLSQIDSSCKVHQITREMRRQLCCLIKDFRLTPTRLRPIEEAIITAGGVNVSEISPKTMESKIVRGLYFAGEVMDLDAYTGGYNLQIAFSTGYVAGMNVLSDDDI